MYELLLNFLAEEAKKKPEPKEAEEKMVS